MESRGIAKESRQCLHVNNRVKTSRRVVAKNRGGRPPKFNEPRRPITVTLPESTLSALRQISPDRSRAIVELAKKEPSSELRPGPWVEVVEIAKDVGLGIVGPSEALRRIPFLRLIEIASARYMLAVNHGHNFHSLEVALTDLIEDKTLAEREFQLMRQLLDRIKGLRKALRVATGEILFVRPD